MGLKSTKDFTLTTFFDMFLKVCSGTLKFLNVNLTRWIIWHVDVIFAEKELSLVASSLEKDRQRRRVVSDSTSALRRIVFSVPTSFQ